MRGGSRSIILINGNARYQNKEILPKNENYILVAPHRTWWDPLYLAVAARPKKFSFMAKEELFKNPIYGSYWSMPMLFQSNETNRDRAR